jgi:hypothetical protein
MAAMSSSLALIGRPRRDLGRLALLALAIGVDAQPGHQDRHAHRRPDEDLGPLGGGLARLGVDLHPQALLLEAGLGVDLMLLLGLGDADALLAACRSASSRRARFSSSIARRLRSSSSSLRWISAAARAFSSSTRCRRRPLPASRAPLRSCGARAARRAPNSHASQPSLGVPRWAGNHSMRVHRGLHRPPLARPSRASTTAPSTRKPAAPCWRASRASGSRRSPPPRTRRPASSCPRSTPSAPRSMARARPWPAARYAPRAGGRKLLG